MEFELQDLRKMKEIFGPISAADRKQLMDTSLKLKEVTRDFEALKAKFELLSEEKLYLECRLQKAEMDARSRPTLVKTAVATSTKEL